MLPNVGSSSRSTTDDLLLLCRRLNEAGAKYLVLGGFAIIQHGFARATEDIDLFIAPADGFRKSDGLPCLGARR